MADYRDAVDTLDNHLVRTGIAGKKRWTQTEPWRYFQRNPAADETEMDPEADKTAQINAIKTLVAQTVPALLKQCQQRFQKQQYDCCKNHTAAHQ